MKVSLFLFMLTCLTTCLTYDIETIFEKINNNTSKFNAIGAKIAWESSTNPTDPELPKKSTNYQRNSLLWQQKTCDELATLFHSHLLNSTQRRQTYLLCRGAKFTFNEARFTSNIYDKLQSIYSDAEVCIPSYKNISIKNLTKIEAAILNYLSKIKQLQRLKIEHHDPILIATKMVVYGDFEKTDSLCLRGEDDFEKLMRFSRNEEVLRWLWLVWREKVGPPMKEPYEKLVNVENLAARRNGYPNIGAIWRDELETPHLRKLCRHLYESIQPLYRLLHGVVRFYLRRHYGGIVPERGPMPAHLLGNLWAQSWEPLADLMLPKNMDYDESINRLNWTVEHMVKRAEDFYQSMGLPAMTDKFWRESIFARENNSKARCHGTAADMFQDGDYRLLYCSETSKEDFYVLHHELGHIQYYMSYSHQPALFRQANSALHETIGDAIMYGVLTPQHLNRLNFINDSELYAASNITEEFTNDDTDDNMREESLKGNEMVKDFDETSNFEAKELYKRYENNAMDEIPDHNAANNESISAKNNDRSYIHSELKYLLEYNDDNNILNHESINKDLKTDNKVFGEDLTPDLILLFKQALNKIPQIPFSLLMDEYRWKYFEGTWNGNGEFWKLATELQGIAPPGGRGENYFDVGAKFHVPDNTPYIRYFLSSFLQHQLFESLCKAATFGRRNVKERLPKTIAVHRCDIYGSKAAGKLLKDLMSRGHSQHWSEILQATIGQNAISAAALHRYYRPLYHKLETFVQKHQIPIGW